MSRSHDDKPTSLSDTLANLVGDAVTDIRQKVIEEGFFGRAATQPIPNRHDSHWEANLWERYGRPIDPANPEREPEVER